MTRDERYQRAKRRVAEIRKLYEHLAICVLVMIVLFIVDYSDRGNWWMYWPAIGWGIAIVLHASRTLGSGWERRRIEGYMEGGESEDT